MRRLKPKHKIKTITPHIYLNNFYLRSNNNYLWQLDNIWTYSIKNILEFINNRNKIFHTRYGLMIWKYLN